jgi:hypothetical protein
MPGPRLGLLGLRWELGLRLRHVGPKGQAGLATERASEGGEGAAGLRAKIERREFPFYLFFLSNISKPFSQSF